MRLAERGLGDREGLLVERLRLGVAAHRLADTGEFVQRRGAGGMRLAERGLVDLEGLLVERLRLGVAAHRLADPGEFVQRRGVGGMRLAERGLVDLEGLLVERLRLGVAAHGLADLGERVKQRCLLGRRLGEVPEGARKDLIEHAPPGGRIEGATGFHDPLKERVPTQPRRVAAGGKKRPLRLGRDR